MLYIQLFRSQKRVLNNFIVIFVIFNLAMVCNWFHYLNCKLCFGLKADWLSVIPAYCFGSMLQLTFTMLASILLLGVLGVS